MIGLECIGKVFVIGYLSAMDIELDMNCPNRLETPPPMSRNRLIQTAGTSNYER